MATLYNARIVSRSLQQERVGRRRRAAGDRPADRRGVHALPDAEARAEGRGTGYWRGTVEALTGTHGVLKRLLRNVSQVLCEWSIGPLVIEGARWYALVHEGTSNSPARGSTSWYPRVLQRTTYLPTYRASTGPARLADRRLQGKYEGLEQILSYGPCQFPTLGAISRPPVMRLSDRNSIIRTVVSLVIIVSAIRNV